MKKLGIFALAALLVVAFTVPASALENVFGGYWRTRLYDQSDFSGDSLGTDDVTQVDTRTRLYYTAILNDNLKLVNKFEMNATWGGQDTTVATPAIANTSYGDVGADGVGVKIKNTYADFNVGPMNFKMGVQAGYFAHGIYYDDDHSGLTTTYAADNMAISLYWIKVSEGGTGLNANDADSDVLVLRPSFTVGDMKIVPWLSYEYQDSTDLAAYNLGLELDAKFGDIGVWFNGIMQGGDQSATLDRAGYCLSGGVNAAFGGVGIHANAFYGSGDDNAADTDNDQFTSLSEYWVSSEVMGYGITDNQAVSPGTANKMAFQVGASFSPVEKLTLGADVWFWYLAEDTALGNDDLGTEIDIKATYMLVDGLKLEVVYGFVSAGDALNETAGADEDPQELAARFSLSF